MRIYQEGFELDPSFVTQNDNTKFLPVARWVSLGNNNCYVSTDFQDVHMNPNGNGGTRGIGIGSIVQDARHMRSPEMPFLLRYAWVGFAMRRPLIGPPSSQFGFSYLLGGHSATAKHMDIDLDFTGRVSIRVNGNIVATNNTPLNAGYHWFSVEYYLHDTNGFINLYVKDVLWLSYSGNTGNTSIVPYWNNLQTSLGNSSSIDDIVVNAATISYTGGVGTPTIDNVMNGGTSGKVARIGGFYERTPGEGYIVLYPNNHNVANMKGFLSGEVLSDGAGWTATSSQVEISLDGFDKNSERPLENFIVVLRPNGDVLTELTGQDGNSGDNYLNVNSDPFSGTVTYNEGGVVGMRDVYTLSNLSYSPLSIDAVEVVTYATRAGAIEGIQHGIGNGTTQEYGAVKRTGSGGSYEKGSEIFDVNPDTGVAWTEGNVNSTNVSVKLG